MRKPRVVQPGDGGQELEQETQRGVEARDNWTRSYAVEAGATLEVRETNGRIRILAGGGNQIEVTATRIAKAPTAGQA